MPQVSTVTEKIHHPVFTISFHLREIPLWSLDWDLPLPFLNPVYEPKSTVHLLTLAFTITNQKVTHKTIALCTSLPLHLCYVYCLFWFLLFLCIISLAFHLLFGPRAASLLLNWLIDWLIDWLIESGYDNIFNLTCVMSIPGETFQTSYVLTTNKTVEQ